MQDVPRVATSVDLSRHDGANCSENTLSKTIAFRYIRGPGLILSTLARGGFDIQAHSH